MKRFVYTSSFAAVACPPTPEYPRREGYMYSEKDFASDGHENDPNWNCTRRCSLLGFLRS